MDDLLNIPADLQDLLSAVFDGPADLEAQRRLADRIDKDPKARALYLHVVRIDVLLRRANQAAALPDSLFPPGNAAAPASPPSVADWLSSAMILPALHEETEMVEQIAPAAPVLSRSPEPRPTRFGWRWAAAALVLLAIGTAILLFGRNTSPVLIAAVDADLNGPEGKIQLGSALPASEVELSTGLVRIALRSGADVVIEAPARFKAAGRNQITLLAGKLSAVVPASAHGFTVTCPAATIVDLGTEFGIGVHRDGTTDIEVFKGTVTISPGVTTPGARPTDVHSPPTVLTAGSARQIRRDGSVATVGSNAAAFVRPADFALLQTTNAQTFQHWQEYSQRMRTDPNLVAYYTFDSATTDPNRLVNESAGGSPLDGNVGDDDPSAMPDWTAGRWPGKGALSFAPGSPQRVSFPDLPQLDFSRPPGQKAMPFTINVWIRATLPGTINGPIIARGDKYLEQYAIDILPGSIIRTWIRGRDEVAGHSDEDLRNTLAPANAWHMATSVYDPAKSTFSLFVDGKQVATTKAPQELMQVQTPPYLGTDKETLDNAPPASAGGSVDIDELAIFNKALSANEINEMYQAEKPN